MDIAEFDAVADDFDRFRALPPGVPGEIRNAMWDALGGAPAGLMLDLGAGTGRIGGAFVAAGDAYLGVDTSARMLGRFAEKAAASGGRVPALVQGDGRSLPFTSATFDAVLMVQVIGGSPGWRRLLSEARRVLRRGGGLVLGKSIGPPDGLDAMMRAQLSRILADAGVEMQPRGVRREEALTWLAADARRMAEVAAARWETMRSPHQFLARHATGARFAALPQSIKDEALRRLAEWAVTTFGALDNAQSDMQTFVLDICVF